MKEDFELASSILWNQISSLFFVLLVVSASLSFFLGEKTDGLIISIITLINIALGFYQEFKASRASQKLLKLVETKVYVFRANVLTQIPSSKLVLGDIVHLVAGSIAPVDIKVTEVSNAMIDDSMRTGETIPKSVTIGETMLSGGEVISGKVIGSVIALGENSTVSQYRHKLESVKKWSDFNLFVANIAKYIFVTAVFMLLIAFVVLVFILHRYDLTEFFIFSIALLVGVVPEALPLIVTLILTRESVQLSKNNVIVKRLSSLQELGAVQFLLTDKTGTITENKLQVESVFVGVGVGTEKFWEVSNCITEGEYERPPMDLAYDAALNTSAKLKTKIKNCKKITSFEPYTNEKGFETFGFEKGGEVVRGIIGKVLSTCSSTVTDEEKKHLDTATSSALQYETKGMRVIAMAERKKKTWTFIGFVAFHDPIKATAAESFRIAHERGVSVKILTGDSEAVARNVATELGLVHQPQNIISFAETKVERLTDRQLHNVVVFAKCTPEDKLALIDRYLHIGPVAFLGDGTNDALALKRADIGIAVDTASDVAKESADVILLEKDLVPILGGVAIGRRSLQNVLTYIMYTLSGNAGTFFSLVVASFFFKALPMLPIQILLNNLLTDLPLMLIITDTIHDQALSHVPHYQPKRIMKQVFAFGLLSSFFDFIYFRLFHHASIENFQTGWFIFSVLTELVLVLSLRTVKPLYRSAKLSVPLFFGLVVSAALSFVFVYVPLLAMPFRFTALSLPTLGILGIIIIIYVFSNEIIKFLIHRKDSIIGE